MAGVTLYASELTGLSISPGLGFRATWEHDDRRDRISPARRPVGLVASGGFLEGAPSPPRAGEESAALGCCAVLCFPRLIGAGIKQLHHPFWRWRVKFAISSVGVAEKFKFPRQFRRALPAIEPSLPLGLRK
jgi:hypothetical protein